MVSLSDTFVWMVPKTIEVLIKTGTIINMLIHMLFFDPNKTSNYHHYVLLTCTKKIRNSVAKSGLNSVRKRKLFL